MRSSLLCSGLLGGQQFLEFTYICSSNLWQRLAFCASPLSTKRSARNKNNMRSRLLDAASRRASLFTPPHRFIPVTVDIMQNGQINGSELTSNTTRTAWMQRMYGARTYIHHIALFMPPNPSIYLAIAIQLVRLEPRPQLIL